MLSLTYSVVCDHCGKTAGFYTQQVAVGESPSIPARAMIFGADVCDDCLGKAKAAVRLALPAARINGITPS